MISNLQIWCLELMNIWKEMREIKTSNYRNLRNFFQRIHKETGGLYEGWLEEIQSEQKNI